MSRQYAEQWSRLNAAGSATLGIIKRRVVEENRLTLLLGFAVGAVIAAIVMAIAAVLPWQLCAIAALVIGLITVAGRFWK